MDDATLILNELAKGDPEAAARLAPLVYQELHAVARRMMQREPAGHTLQPTAVVHEAYLRLIDQTRVVWRSRSHFVAVAAELIRRILVDHARKRLAEKRGGGLERAELREDHISARADPAAADPADARQVELLALDDALSRLAQLSPRQARIVELRFFGGLSVEETAALLDLSERTVKDEWRVAKAWLRAEMEK